MTHRSLGFAALALLTLPAVAQQALTEPAAEVPATPPQQRLTTTRVLGPADFLVPIHRARGNAMSEQEQLWAGGPGYAVSFGETVAFWPNHAEEEAPAPWRWRTESVRIGESDLVDVAVPVSRWTTERFELDYGELVEAYDVRKDGVEQTFTIAERPAQRGDLVVRGAVTFAGPGAVDQPDRHGAVPFSDADGRELVHYGAAWALDAAGDKIAMTTRYRDGALELRLGAAWLEDAAFPIVVDPLISTVSVVPFTLPVEVVGQARDDVANQLMIIARSGVEDFAYLCNDDYSSPTLIRWTYDSTTKMRDVAFVGDRARRWIIASSHSVSPATPASPLLSVYFHSSGTTLYNSGVDRNFTPSSDIYDVAVGGSIASGNNGILVYRSTYPVPFAKAIIVDAYRRSLGGPVDVALADQVAVNPVAGGGGDPWLVCTRYDGHQDRYRLVKVSPTGRVSRAYPIPTAALGDSLPMKIAGMDGRYMVVYGDIPVGLSKMRQVDWSGSGVPVFRLEHNTDPIDDIAFDTTTRSQWCILRRFSPNRLFLARLGATTLIAESAFIPARAWSTPWEALRPESAITYNDDDHTFAASSPGPRGEWQGSVLAHDPRVSTATYGAGCGGRISSPDQPYVGRDNFRVRLTYAAPNAAATLFISLRPAFVPLAGCTVLVDLDRSTYLLAYYRIRASAMGSAEHSHDLSAMMPSPARFYYHGSIYYQWVHSTLTGLKFTQGLRADVYP